MTHDIKSLGAVRRFMKDGWFAALALLWFLFADVARVQAAETDASVLPISLTPEERVWLDEGHRVRVRIVDWPPYMMTTPMPSGVAVDYLDAIAKRFNFRVEYVITAMQWSEAMADVRGARAHFDLLPTMYRTPEREQAFALTNDYLTAPWVVYTRNDTPYIAGLEGLSGKTLAAEKGYAITDMIRTDYPRIRILEVGWSWQALQAVVTGQADAYVGNLATANFLIKQNRFTNLVVAAGTPFGEHAEGMAVRNDWRALASLINKGLAAMTPAEINAINQKWGAVEVRPQIDYRLVWQVVAGATLILLAVFSWNRRLAREVAVRQRIAADLLASQADLTEEKRRLQRAQRALQHLNQTLEDQVRHRVAELESTNETLRRSEERHRLLADNARDVIWSMALDGTITYVSPAVEKVRGFTPAEAMRQPLDAIHTPDSQAIVIDYFKGLHAAIQAGRAPENFRGELEYRCKDGSTFWTEVMAYPLMGPDGTFVEILGMTRDIDERKRYASVLQQARDAADAANRAKSAFLANMSHEIRTPLNAILGFTQVLARDPDLSAAQRDSLATIHRSSDHLLTLINDILDMAKIEAGRITLQAAPFDLAALVTETEAFFRQRAQELGLALTVAAVALPRMVIGDLMKLRQVLLNLVGNAIKFTTAGAVTLRVAPVAGDAIRFSVIDTGMGIASEEMARLFQPFSQTASGRLKPGGTGLGLALSSQFVRLMGGELTAESTPGQGSCFAFTLTLPPAAVAEARDPDPLPPILGLAAGQPVCRILIVDDLPDNRAPLRALLESLNPQPPVLEIREAANGQEAVAIWEAWQPHVILMDMRMPELSGEEATLQIKARMAARPETVRSVVVALSASAFNEHRDHFLACGCDAFTGKPFRAEELFAILERRAGLRFRRAGAVPTADVPLSPDELGARLSTCPAAWRADLRSAVALGDFDRITALVAQLGETDAALHGVLAPLAYNYDLEAFTALFSPVEAGALPPPQPSPDHHDAEGPGYQAGEGGCDSQTSKG
jgi:two-component system, sensor histidine kinase and response regulator